MISKIREAIDISWICDLSVGEYIEAAMHHNESTQAFIEKALQLAKSNPHEITTGCSNFGKEIKKRANQVLREIHLISAYMRLKPLPEMILVGKCKPEHDVVYFIAKSIAKRFDQFIIVVFAHDNFAIVSNRRDIPEFPSFQGSSRESILESVRAFARLNIDYTLPEDIVLEEGAILWENYYATQFLEQRLNPKLFHKFIPKYALEKAEMEIESKFLSKVYSDNKKSANLDDYFEKINQE
ncbi:DUF4130 domain-containing protein [Candidatus Heimdallarchaeota archaeon]|nr:MAG: DUF4130 domain-containing protein [Candidatus Heimdallarchaeota archaeon]